MFELIINVGMAYLAGMVWVVTVGAVAVAPIEWPWIKLGVYKCWRGLMGRFVAGGVLICMGLWTAINSWVGIPQALETGIVLLGAGLVVWVLFNRVLRSPQSQSNPSA